MMRWLAASLVAAALVPSAAARDRKPQELDLAGTYAISEGKLADGSAYEGTVAIRPKAKIGGKRGETLWGLEWHIAGKDQPVYGIGVVLDRVFVVAYGSSDDDGWWLEVLQRVGRGEHQGWMNADDTHRGTWFKPSGDYGQEGLRGSIEEYEGAYRMHGHTMGSDGPTRPYGGTLQIEKNGEVLSLGWRGAFLKRGKDEALLHHGVGMWIPGDLVIAVWGLESNGGAGVYVLEEGAFKGMYVEKDGIGNEKLALPQDVAARAARFFAEQ